MRHVAFREANFDGPSNLPYLAVTMKMKQPMEPSSIMLTRMHKQIWVAAAQSMGVSRSAFLRLALKEKALRVLRQERRNGDDFSPTA